MDMPDILMGIKNIINMNFLFRVDTDIIFTIFFLPRPCGELSSLVVNFYVKD